MKTLRVLVADDHRLMLAAVRRALADAPDFEIVHEVSVGSHVLPAVREHKPDVVLLDLRMPELDGLACLERLRKYEPSVAAVILSSYSDPEQIDAARKGGARGYVVKTVEPVDLPTVLRTALSGTSFTVWGAEAEQSPAPVVGANALSERETAVLEAVARGLSNREIANELVVEDSTVRSHVKRILMKLGLRDRVQVVIFAYETGINRT